MTLAIVDEFNRQNLNNPANVDDAVAAFGQAAIWCDAWYRGISPERRPGALFILGGYRHPPGGPAVPPVYILNSQSVAHRNFPPGVNPLAPMMPFGAT
jgi:hypothetical protein